MYFTAADTQYFPGRYSLWPNQVQTALNALDWEALRDAAGRYRLAVLEFGAGRGTTALAELLERKGVQFTYRSYEQQSQYLSSHPAVEGVLYTAFPAELPPYTPDLVLIDGPNGVERAQWYRLLAAHVQPGCILLIDDCDHYLEYTTALDTHFEYVIIEHVNLGMRPGASTPCWKTVRVVATYPEGGPASNEEGD